MALFLKTRSRTVHHHQDEEKEYKNQETCCVSLTVWRKSLILSCKGFTVIGSDGNFAYRVDNYTHRPGQIILMDGSGYPIFTICRRKKLKVVAENQWLVYEGEVAKKNLNNSSLKKPVFCARKNTSIMKTGVLAYVYGAGVSEKGFDYMIEGSYEHRSCKILDGSKRVVSEIKKKESVGKGGGVSFGLEVFDLIINPGIDSKFAMAIVLILDQMFS